MKKACTILLVLLTGCVTQHPAGYGAVAGAGIGAGVGAIVASSSSDYSLGRSMGFGAAIGVPAGIAVGYAANETAKYYILSSNNDAIDLNNEMIVDNQNEIQYLRDGVAAQEPIGLPDEDRAEHIYVGPSLGNSWR